MQVMIGETGPCRAGAAVPEALLKETDQLILSQK